MLCSVAPNNNQPAGSQGSTENTQQQQEQKALDFLAARGKALGVPLSLEERAFIIKQAGNCGGKLNADDWQQLIRTRQNADVERLTLSEFLSKSYDLHLGQLLLKYTAWLGISFFSLVGAHTAGEAGMHVVGASFVGVVTGLGGGTINNVMVGATPVGWMKDVSFLASAILAAVAGFYLWPLAERVFDDGGGSSTDGTASAAPSLLRYSFESVALGSLAVIGAQQGIARGLHPLVSSCLGVTVVFGGVLRDLMCQHEVLFAGSEPCPACLRLPPKKLSAWLPHAEMPFRVCVLSCIGSYGLAQQAALAASLTCSQPSQVRRCMSCCARRTFGTARAPRRGWFTAASRLGCGFCWARAPPLVCVHSPGRERTSCS